MNILNQVWPESFNDLFSWKWFERLRYKNAPFIPVFGENPMYEPKDVAWHMDIPTVFPHTKRYRALRAICRDDLSDLRKVLDEGFDINSEVDLQEGKTALGLAAYLERPRLLNYLIMRGANIDQGDSQGNTPLHDAVDRANFESIIVLTQHGASPKIPNKFKASPLARAEERNQGHILGLLQSVDKKQAPGVLPKYTVGFKFEEFLGRTDTDAESREGVQTSHGKRLYFTEGNTYPFNTLTGAYVLNLYVENEVPLA